MECGNEKDSHSALGKGNGAVRINWGKLTDILIDEYQGSPKLAKALHFDGIDIDESTFRYYRQQRFGKRSTRDVAVWMYLEAQKRGLEIPYLED